MADVYFVVTAAHNRREITRPFAQQLARQLDCQPQLVLVDDGSTDGTAAAVVEVLPSAVVVRGDGSLWWGGALRRAVSWLRAHGPGDEAIVAFMNDDIEFDDDYLARARDELVGLGRGCFLVSPGRYKTSGRWAYETGVTDWSRLKLMHYGNRPDLCDHATTRCLFMFWGDLKQVKGFHPTLVPHYTSDYVFTMAAHRQGIRLVPAQTISARFNDEATGPTGLRGRSWAAKWRLLWSPRFASNPLHWLAWVYYSCPWYYWIPNAARIGLATLRHLLSR